MEVDNERHEFELHVDDGGGAPRASSSSSSSSPCRRSPSQCSLCALHLCQLYAMQSTAHLLILSHQYENKAMHVRVRCNKCMKGDNRQAEDLLHPQSILCRHCNRDRKTSDKPHNESSSAATAPIPSLPEPPPALVPITTARVEYHSLSDDDVVVDEDVSVVSLLHRQVVNDATRLKQRERQLLRRQAAKPNHSSTSAVGSRDAPIIVDDAPISDSNSTTPLAAPRKPAETSPAAAATANATMTHSAGKSTPRKIQPNLTAARKRAATSADKPRASPNTTTDEEKQESSPTKKQRTSPAAPGPHCLHHQTPAATTTSSSLPPASAFAAAAAASFNATSSSPNFGFVPPPHGSAHHIPSPRSSFAASPPSPPGGSRTASDIFAEIHLRARPIDPYIRAQKQREMFEAARKRLDMRRKLNIEPEMPPDVSGESYLPYHKGAKHVPDSSMAEAARQHNVPFSLPNFFRAEAGKPYTSAERQAACTMLLSLRSNGNLSTVAWKALCLPNGNTRSWPAILRSKSHSHSSAAAANSESKEADNNNPSTFLSKHYRRLAKLVHPDKCGVDAALRQDAENAFKILQQAYEILLKTV